MGRGEERGSSGDSFFIIPLLFALPHGVSVVTLGWH